MSIRRPKHPIATAFSWLLMVFLVLFPKGGFKIGMLPLTWGYLILAASTPILLMVRVLAFPLRVNKRAGWALLLLSPLQLVIFYAYMMYGVIDSGFAFATFVSFFFLPPLFLLIYSSFLVLIDGRRLSSYLRGCMLFAALWGIGLFIQHPITGHFLEIPYLTVNAQDYGLIEATKHIARGPFLKLISTYNNGNLYGAATLILLPLYDHLEPSRWRRSILKIALLLTLSRTVWFGLIANEIVPLVGHIVRQVPSFPVIRFSGISRRLIAIGLVVGLVFCALIFVPNRSPLEFLLDPTAGGRVSEVSTRAFTFLPNSGLQAFLEVVYLAALQDLGYVGLFGMVLLMTSPLILLVWDRSALQSPLRSAALRGLMVYAIVALSDGAINYIPVMAFYWFTYMIYIFGWPAFMPVPSRRVSLFRLPQPEQPHPAGMMLSNRAN